MLEKHLYTVPDYYPDFHCKMGACRSACCEGWPVSISLEDYYKLLSSDVSPELKHRIDSSLHLHEHPTQEDYAFIAHNYLGSCPLRLLDGRCGLHAEAGEEALSAVCRLYPRGPRAEGDFECSCANSCEGVIELFLHRTEPIGFIQRELAFDLPAQKGRSIYFETVGREQELRLYLIRLMQDRSLRLPLRLMRLADALDYMDKLLADKDEKGIDALLNGAPVPAAPAEAAAGAAQLEKGLEITEKMMEVIDDRSDSVRGYGADILNAFKSAAEPLSAYEEAKARFEKLLPNHEIFFEHMLVNHMFFERFPFQDRPLTLYDEFIAMCAGYSLLRFLCVGSCLKQASESDIADVCAAAFRLVDHTSFDHFSALLFRRLEFTSRAQMVSLISL